MSPILKKLVVVCVNSNGDPDYFLCQVTGNQLQYDSGAFADAARDAAADNGFDPVLTFDEDAPLFSIVKPLDWSSVPFKDISWKQD